jgi:hypothetical protein
MSHVALRGRFASEDMVQASNRADRATGLGLMDRIWCVANRFLNTIRRTE